MTAHRYRPMMKVRKDDASWDKSGYSVIHVTNAPSEHPINRTFQMIYDSNRGTFWRGYRELYKSSDYVNWANQNINDDLQSYNGGQLNGIRSLHFDINTGDVFLGTGYTGLFRVSPSGNLSQVFDANSQFAIHRLGSFQNRVWYGEKYIDDSHSYIDTNHQISIHYKSLSTDSFTRVPLSGDSVGAVLGQYTIAANKLVVGRLGDSPNQNNEVNDSFIHVIDSQWNEIAYKKLSGIRFSGAFFYEGYLYVHGTDLSNNNLIVQRTQDLNNLNFSTILNTDQFAQIRGMFSFDGYIWGFFRKDSTDETQLIGNILPDFSNIGASIDAKFKVFITSGYLGMRAGYAPFTQNTIYFGSAQKSGAIYKLVKN